jgi:hypothetical protein
MRDDERVKTVINNLSSLIIHHAGLTASEQYHPRNNPDESDEHIKAHTHWVTELRSIRERFENLVTGIIGDSK